MNSKQKGKRGELELAKVLKEYGFDDAHRTVQYNGKADYSRADLVGLPGIHIECKRVEKINIEQAMEQAIRDHAMVKCQLSSTAATVESGWSQ